MDSRRHCPANSSKHAKPAHMLLVLSVLLCCPSYMSSVTAAALNCMQFQWEHPLHLSNALHCICTLEWPAHILLCCCCSPGPLLVPASQGSLLRRQLALQQRSHLPHNIMQKQQQQQQHNIFSNKK